MDLQKLHLVKGRDMNIAFYYPAYSVVQLPDETYGILEDLKKGKEPDSVASARNRSAYEIKQLLEKLDQTFSTGEAYPAGGSPYNKRIGRITLHVSNDCNLRCRYCYACGGSYDRPRELMTKETAREFVEFCAKTFDHIGRIVFFGGEPLLNPGIIAFICELFTEYKALGKITYLPVFGIITNGTILNDPVLEIIKRYVSFITVSIDGPQELNDRNRIYSDGRGSYNRIAGFIRRIVQIPSVSVKYEATYTDYHIEQGVSQQALSHFFKREFGLEGTIVEETNISNKRYWDGEDSEYLADNTFSTMPDGFWSILSAIVCKQPKGMCPVYRGIFAVSVKGDIFPCHMNTGTSGLALGHISGKNIFNSPQVYEPDFPLFFKLHDKAALCGGCWAQNICGGCTMKWFYDKQSGTYNVTPDKEMCEFNRKHIENILLLITRIRKDPEKWPLFLARCK